MDYQITQLSKKDFIEAMSFMSFAFNGKENPADFPTYLPSLYKPTEKHMTCHYVIREEGCIKALIGIYPTEIMTGRDSLKLAQIGGVCTHPDYRGKGMMNCLMKFAVDEIRRAGYDLVRLAGNRDRYKYFGFEKGGSVINFWITPDNFKHNLPADESLIFSTLDHADRETILKLLNVYNLQHQHIVRTEDNFVDLCNTFGRKAHVAMKDGDIAGYLIAAGDEEIAEISAKTDNIRLAMIKEFCKTGISVGLNLLEKNFIEMLGNVAESRWINESGSWQIFNYEKVLTILLKSKNDIYRLRAGKAHFGLENIGNFIIRVSKDEISCKMTNEKPEVVFEQTKFIRIVFGPLQPKMIQYIPDELNILDNWFPLPLSFSSQDNA